MRFGPFKFGALGIDGATYDHDVIIERGRVRKRRKKASKPFRGSYGHPRSSMRRKRAASSSW